MKHYFLGMAANYGGSEWLKHTFAFGRKKDCRALKQYLSDKYSGEAILCKNGRSALTLALMGFFKPGDMILVNGFTCYAVYEAVKAAKLVPVFVDISKKDLNYSLKTLNAVKQKRFGMSSEDSSDEKDAAGGDKNVQSESAREDWSRVKGIIVQNTLGNPVDIAAIEGFAKENDLLLIEDLAHSAGVRYKDKREAGTVGVATVWSFGKDKAIDTISGGAVVFRRPRQHEIKAPSKAPKPSDHLRARFYPTLGAICRGLSYIKLGGVLMRGFVKIHWVEKSADNKLDITRRPSKFEAKLALEQLQNLRRNGEPPLRDFCFVKERAELLKTLQKKGYYFAGLWYEKPVSPERYYQKVRFPEKDCPNAVYVAEHIINIPTYYTAHALAPARKIIKKYLEEGQK